MEIHRAAEESGQFLLHPEKGQPGRLSGSKFHEHVDVTLAVEVIPQNRAKDGEAQNRVTPAENGQLLGGDSEAIPDGIRLDSRHEIDVVTV